MKKKTGVLLSALLLAMLSACGKGQSTEFRNAAKGERAVEAAADTTANAAPKEAVTEEIMESDTGEAGTAGAGSDVKAADSSRKLIRYEDYAVETKEFDKFVEKLNRLVDGAGGYVEYSEVFGNDYGMQRNRNASYTLRIPVKGLENFKTEIQNMGNVTRQSERVEDVTLHYVDTESHIKALKSEQESLMGMLEKAETLEAILAIQNRLTEVRYQLESYEAQIRTYDNAIEYSTITLYLSEVERETTVSETFGAKLKERFLDSLYGVKEGFVSLALLVLGGLPYWIIPAVILAATVFAVKRVNGKNGRRKKFGKTGKEETESKITEEKTAEKRKE